MAISIVQYYAHACTKIMLLHHMYNASSLLPSHAKKKRGKKRGKVSAYFPPFFFACEGRPGNEATMLAAWSALSSIPSSPMMQKTS